MKILKPLLLNIIITLLLSGCGSVKILSTPIENIDNTPIKINELSEIEKQIWSHLDLVNDTIPGMSINRAYNEIIKGKKGKTVIVAVIDSGIDIDHEDLDDVIWVNKKEIPNNGKDDDNNGYVDDINGWNFLGDAYDEQMEFVRLLASGNTTHPDYKRAQIEYDKEYKKFSNYKTQYKQIIQQLNDSDKAVSSYLKKADYTKEDLNEIKTEDKELVYHVWIIKQYLGNGFNSTKDFLISLNDDLKQINERLNFHLNKEFKGRKTGDNPDDFSQKVYGNANVKPVKKDESHGTHVAGIIAAERNNGLGVNGVAKNVKIMVIRNTPNGDEYDKDVALGIRYAVDNGAKIINMSFGKYYSPHSNWVMDAIAYAGQHDVLIIHGAGNESLDLDKKANYPTDQVNNGKEVSNTFLNVGATVPKYGSGLVADYSNYGKINVDVFAPGSKIYSTFPENEYNSINGTSMAAPAVAGIAALIRSYYPNLSAAQVKQVLMNSGLPIKAKVLIGKDLNTAKPFEDLSKSAKLVNAYNALIMADHLSKTKIAP
ncbi:MAG: peptidase S8 [Bacteroidetes bacterium]|nr:MAG: peptidase S8 [Bacteroidota bacterium]